MKITATELQIFLRVREHFGPILRFTCPVQQACSHKDEAR